MAGLLQSGCKELAKARYNPCPESRTEQSLSMSQTRSIHFLFLLLGKSTIINKIVDRVN